MSEIKTLANKVRGKLKGSCALHVLPVFIFLIVQLYEVNRHRARLVLGWVTVCGRVNYFGM